MVTDYHGFFLYVPNYRIFLFHTEFHGESRVFSLCPELSNYRIFLFHTEFHGESRMFFFIPNYRIIEFLFTRSSTENHGFIFFVMNSLIRKFGIKKNIRDIP